MRSRGGREPDDRILVPFFEDFVRDQAATMRRYFASLGLKPLDRVADVYAKNVSEDSREDTVALIPLRRLPFFDRLRDAMPAGIRESLGRVLK